MLFYVDCLLFIIIFYLFLTYLLNYVFFTYLFI